MMEHELLCIACGSDCGCRPGSHLAVSSYVLAEDTREKIDIKLLNAQIALIVMRQQELRAKIQKIIMDLERRSGLNSIEALIEKLCPEGVELGEVGSTYNGLS